MLEASTREAMEKVLKQLAGSPVFSECSVDMAYIDRCIANISDFRGVSERECEIHCSRELSVSLLWILTVAHLSLAVHQEGIDPPLPPSWADGRLDPNVVLQALLTQIANHALSTVYLTYAGLDPSARATLRALMETYWLAICVAYDRELMADYCRADAEGEEGLDTWRKRFSPTRLMKRLDDIEDHVFSGGDSAGDDSLRHFLAKERREAYRFYSGFAHSACPMILCSAWAFPISGDVHELRLLGHFSVGSKATLAYLSQVLFCHTRFLVYMINRHHHFSIPAENELWITTAALMCCAETAYLWYLAQEDGTDYLPEWSVRPEETC